jgi:hypothetical protein
LNGYTEAPPAGQQAKGIPIARASCDVTIQHPCPVISKFIATPAVWPFELGPISVALSWTVDWIETFGERSLTLSGEGGQSLAADRTNCLVPNINGPQRWTLQATGRGGRVAQQETEIKDQPLTDYLYHPPRRYKGSATATEEGVAVPINTTVELILSDLEHNTLNFTITYQGLDQPIRNAKQFTAKLDQGVLIIPDSGGNPENTLHFRVTPGALVLTDPSTSSGAFGIPRTLHEEKSQ